MKKEISSRQLSQRGAAREILVGLPLKSTLVIKCSSAGEALRVAGKVRYHLQAVDGHYQVVTARTARHVAPEVVVSWARKPSKRARKEVLSGRG
jgi:hypothetical protein